MEEKLSIDEVKHVAELAKIRINDQELEKYQIEVKGYDEEIIITPTEEKCELRKDEIGDMLNPKDILKNVPRHSGNYIEVPVVINE